MGGQPFSRVVPAEPRPYGGARFRSAAILCSGPSLHRYWTPAQEAKHDLVVAVNTAAWHCAHDWMVAIDEHSLQPLLEDRIRPRIGVGTSGKYRSRLLKRGLQYYPLFQIPGCNKSFPNALMMVLAFRVSQVHVFGFDATGGPDVAGTTASDHSTRRWHRELQLLRPLWNNRIFLHSDLPEIHRRYLRRDLLALDPKQLDAASVTQ